MDLSIGVLSSLPFLIGFTSGNWHAFTFLLVSAISVACLNGAWFLAGVLAAVLLYKPQFIVGFAIVFVLWRKLGALLGMSVTVFALYSFASIATSAALLSQFRSHAESITRYIPFAREFPQYAVGSLYVQLATVLPRTVEPLVWYSCAALSAVLLLMFARIVWRNRHAGRVGTQATVGLCSLVPLCISPYWIVYDTISVLPGVILLMASAEADVRDGLLAASLLYCLPAGVVLFGMATGQSISGLLWIMVIVLAAWLLRACGLLPGRMEMQSDPN